MFKVLGQILKSTVDVTLLPVDIVKDAVTVCVESTTQEQTSTEKRVDKIVNDLDKLMEEL